MLVFQQRRQQDPFLTHSIALQMSPLPANPAWRRLRHQLLAGALAFTGAALAVHAAENAGPSDAVKSKAIAVKAKSDKAVTAAKRSHVNKHKRPSKVRPAANVGPAYATRPEVMRFADELAARRGLNPQWVRRAIGQATLVPSVVRLMQPSTQPFVKNWTTYRGRFIDATRIEAGVQFWQDNQATLARAEKEFGVPSEIIVGIIGVESIYGRNTGSFRVIDAITTLAFDFPASHPRAAERAEFFKGEIEQFLSLQSRMDADPLLPLGSYAGAMGLPQFLPSSWARFAVDFDGDAKIDLWHSPADAIGSVANYFKAFGWQPGMPTHYPVRFDSAKLDLDALMAPDILPTFSVASFSAKGAVLDGSALQHPGPLALVELLNGPDPASYVAGTENFYAITRYNWSSYYAMAVIELAEAVAREVKSRP
ncbi:MAG: membrane-bound lytic murein transglycosylase B [Polaromonas sp.]